MFTINDLQIDYRYNRVLSNWNNKIHKLEKSCRESETVIDESYRITLQNKIENLKSYLYSVRYYATSIEEDSKNRMRELLTEMKRLSSEISLIINKQETNSKEVIG
jgi:hypothetical protein